MSRGAAAGVQVFLSHAWIDNSPERASTNPRRALARVLRDHLAAQGLRLFYDENDIQELDDIEQRIRRGMANSTLFVCWFSDAYLSRRACNWELTAALTNDPTRIVVVNPEQGVDHILPASLRSALVAAARDATDHSGWVDLARRIADRARTTPGVYGELSTAQATRWHGHPPARFHRFTGRAQEIWRLDSALRPATAGSGGGNVPAAVVLHGLGGVGKTAMAREYAARFAGAYPSGVFWLRATTGELDRGDPANGDAAASEGRRLAEQLADQLIIIAAQLAPPDPDIAGAGERTREAALHVIRRHLTPVAKPYLWIVDDLLPGLPARDFGDWLAPTCEGRVLVTTRATTYRHVPNIALSVMPPAEAVELLNSARASAGDLPDATSRSIADRVGCLPLALEVVGALSAVPGVRAETLLSALPGPVELAERAAASPFASASATEHTLSIDATFGPSIARLDQDSYGLLATAAALNVGPLPAAAITQIAEGVAGLRRQSRHNAVAMLLSRSLARPVDAETLEVHALVGGATLRTMPNAAAFVQACINEAARTLVALIADPEDIRTHRSAAHYAEFGVALMTRGQRPSDTAAEIEILRCLGRYMNLQHRYGDAVVLERRAIAAGRELLGPADRTTLATIVNLSISLSHAGDEALARQLLTEAADQLERQFGPDDTDVLSAKHNLAWQLYSVDAGTARRLARAVYESRRRVLGPSHPHTLHSMHLMLVRDDVPPGYPDTPTAYADLVTLRSAVLGEDAAPTLYSISNLVLHLIRSGRADEAVRWARRLLEARMRLYGQDHPATWTAVSRLVNALAAAPHSSEQEIDDLLSRLTDAPSPSDIDGLLGALSTTGESLRQNGRLEQAARVLETAAGLASTVPAVSPRIALLVRHNAAAVVAARGDLLAAKTEFDRLVPTMARALGDADRLTLRARRQQAILAAQLGDATQALTDQRALVAAWQALAGESSVELAEALDDLARTLRQLGREGEAEEVRRRRLATGVADVSAAGFV